MRVAALTTTINTIVTNGLRRGDPVNGGRFVGQHPRSSVWVCYESGELPFVRMCEAFDRLYVRREQRRAAVA